MSGDRRDFLAAGAAVAGAAALGSAPARAAGEFVTLTTPAGVLRGRRADGINIFTGVPFGKSTAGAARFGHPVAAPPLAGVFDATGPAAVPPQTISPMMPAPGPMSEDCLQLNVWAPQAPGPHPVFVWIYGGGNISGACGMPIYDGAAFARDGIVTININYRVGALGFLELGGIRGSAARGSGNNAMRDQLLALQWVKRNVFAFGGDPTRVTVGGESGGAFNIVCLMASPAARGLFHRAIVASGGESVQTVASADAFAKIFVEEFGGPSRLQSAPFDEIVAAQPKAAARWPLAAPFRQIVVPGLLPVAPIEAIAQGAAREVELMIGVTRDETRMLVTPAVAASSDPQVQPSNLKASQLAPFFAAYAKAYPTLSQAELTWKVTTAEAFGIPSLRIAGHQSATGAKVYRYVIDYPLPGGPLAGVSPHGMDLPLIFENLASPLAHVFGYSAVDLPMANKVHAAWSAFIRTGIPAFGEAAWPAYETKTQQTMVLGGTTHVVSDFDKVDRPIWAGTRLGL